MRLAEKVWRGYSERLDLTMTGFEVRLVARVVELEKKERQY